MNTEQIVQDEVENFVINSQWLLLDDPLRHAIREAIMRERDACAKVCESLEIPDPIEGAHPDYVDGTRMAVMQSAAAIRARGNE